MKYLFWLLLLLSQSIHAFECDASTTPNGDLLVAYFTQCGLGLHAHYYSTESLDKMSRRHHLALMLAAVLPTGEVGDDLKPQLQKIESYADGAAMNIAALNDSHDFIYRAPESPLFQTSLHYKWYPPAY